MHESPIADVHHSHALNTPRCWLPVPGPRGAGRSDLHEAARHNEMHRINRCSISAADVLQPDPEGITPFMDAVNNDNLDITRELYEIIREPELRLSCCLLGRDKQGWTLMHWAAHNRSQFRACGAIDWLITASLQFGLACAAELLGVDVGPESSPLACAAACGYPVVVQRLLDWCKLLDEKLVESGLPAHHNLQKLLQQQNKECYNPAMCAAAASVIPQPDASCPREKSKQIIEMLTEQVGHEPPLCHPVNSLTFLFLDSVMLSLAVTDQALLKYCRLRVLCLLLVLRHDCHPWVDVHQQSPEAAYHLDIKSVLSDAACQSWSLVHAGGRGRNC